MAKTLTILEASIQRKTGNQLTNQSDKQTYLALAWEQVQSDWAKFDPGLFRDPTKQSSTTDSNGIAELDADVMRLERVEDSNENKYDLIDNIDNINEVTGYYFGGYDTTNNAREVQFIKNGEAVASTAFSYYQIKRYALDTSAGTKEVRIADEYADIVAIKGAQLWHEDQGPPMQETAEKWEARYNRRLSDAKAWYKNPTKDPKRVPIRDPDAGGGLASGHIVS